ncbi:MAG: T9SS type A sorting domain-containing protein [Myroides sp.]
MKNKLHTISFHVERSRDISKNILFSFLFLLSSFFSTAQNYEWNWAVSGGSPNNNEPSIGLFDYSEQIYDIKTDSNGNYYFIATMKGLNLTQLNGQPVTTYNTSLGGNDIFIFSTTCDGTMRWSQAIGGGGTGDSAYNIVLDSNDNVYIGARVGLVADPLFPVHFSATETLSPVPSNPNTVGDGWKTSFIVKYNSNGIFQWKKAVQGDVKQDNFESYIHDIVIDSQNKLHFIVGFAAGTHLDGMATVPSTFTNYTYQYYVVKFNTVTQQFDNVLLLPLTGRLEQGDRIIFAYDEALNRYYLAGVRSLSINGVLTPLSYDNKPFIERSFIMAFNGFNSTTGIDGVEIWRREIYSDQIPIFTHTSENKINSLVIGANSDVYVGGTLFTYNQNPLPVKIYDPSDTQVAPYTFTPGIYGRIPAIIKFNSANGTVQWAKTPTAHASNFTTPGTGSYENKGLAIRGNEIVFGANSAYFIWDNFVQNPAQFTQISPALMRFNTQTGNTLGMHIIESPKDYTGFTTAVTVDNDGNYITGGAFHAVLFTNNVNVNQLVSSGGADFFVAKLAASTCGTAVSTDKFNKLNVNVYPNPTHDIVNIETQETLHNYEVYNVLGQQIQKGMFNGNNQINLHGATAGTYFIKVTTIQGSTATVKVIKK